MASYDPFRFGTHWHNVFLILLVIAVGSIALVETISLFSNGASASSIAKTVILWLFTLFGAVWLGMHIKPRLLLSRGLNLLDPRSNNRKVTGLFADPLDTDTDTLAAQVVYGSYFDSANN